MISNRARARQRNTRRGVLTFEWILLVALLVVGLIAGLAGLRNALLDQLYDLQSAVEGMNFSGTGSVTANSSTATTKAQRALNSRANVGLSYGNPLVSGAAKGVGNTSANGSGNTSANGSSNTSAKCPAIGNDSLLDPDAPVRDTASSHDTPTDAGAWWNAGYR